MNVYNTSNTDPPNGTGGAGYVEDLTGAFANTYKAISSRGSDEVTAYVQSNSQAQLGVPAGSSFTTGILTGTQSPNSQDYVVNDPVNYLSSAGATVTIYFDDETFVSATANAGSNKGFAAANASTFSSGDITLIYTYTAVPEPSETAAYLIGFALCLLMGRRYFNRFGFRLAT
jgi:hypothetical protein